MRAKLIENLNSQFNFDYFNLPYQIPEDRFNEKGLVIGSNERTTLTRKLKKDYSQLQYKSVKDYLENVDFGKIQLQVDSDVKEILAFISNNPLTKNLLKPKYHQELNLEKYLGEYYGLLSEWGENWDAHIGWINCGLELGILVDYDIYKGKTLFTFVGDTMFYYYTVYTLGKNDVVGSGEEHTYYSKGF